VRVTDGGRDLRMAEEPSDEGRPNPPGTEARVGVPQIVQAHAYQTCPLGHGIPRTVQIVPGLLRMREHVEVIEPLVRMPLWPRAISLGLLPEAASEAD
jgi:hypothetical protein